jgi:MFS transporter, OFA family, oxalate/formate antiporter
MGGYNRRIFRGWIVLASCFCMTFTIGIQSAFSDFFLPLSKQFGWNYATVSSIGSVMFVTFSFGTIIGALSISKLGMRRTSYFGTAMFVGGIILSSRATGFWELVVLFGGVAALGSAFTTIVATVLTVKWFVKRRGFAVGVMTAGSSVGALVIPPLAGYIIVLSSWETTLTILGVFFFVIISIASYFMRTPEETAQKPYGFQEQRYEDRAPVRKDLTARQATRTAPFWIIYLQLLLGSTATLMFSVHAVPFAESHGISGLLGATALGVYGAGSLIARIGLGVLSDRISRVHGLVIAFLIPTFAMAALPFIGSSSTLFFACAFGVGFGYGGYFADFISLSGDLFGTKSIDRIWSIYETSWGIGGLLGPILAGAFFDIYSTYTGIFETAAIGLGFSIVLCFLLAKKIAVLAPNLSDKSRNTRIYFHRKQR